jgi:prophage regulatory protein
MSDKRLVSRRELRERYGITYSDTHLLRLERAGEFPKRVRLTPRPRAKVWWLEVEIEAWLAERTSNR